jgi:hypothetical protein
VARANLRDGDGVDSIAAGYDPIAVTSEGSRFQEERMRRAEEIEMESRVWWLVRRERSRGRPPTCAAR